MQAVITAPDIRSCRRISRRKERGHDLSPSNMAAFMQLLV